MFETEGSETSPGAQSTLESDQMIHQEPPGDVYPAKLKAIFQQNALKVKLLPEY